MNISGIMVLVVTTVQAEIHLVETLTAETPETTHLEVLSLQEIISQGNSDLLAP